MKKDKKNQNDNAVIEVKKVRENYIAGVIGAILATLVGCVAWFLLQQINIVSGWVGLITAMLAIKAYAKFGRKESVKGTLTAALISLAGIVGIWYVCIALDINKVYKEAFESGNSIYTLTFEECLMSVWTFVTKGEFIDGATIDNAAEAMKDYWIGFALGVGFWALGSFGLIGQAFKNRKQAKLAAKADSASE